MLNFITDICKIKRQEKDGYKKTYEVVYEDVEIDIQHLVGDTLGVDMVKDTYKAYIYTKEKEMVKYNDIIETEEENYVVQEAKFWKGDEVFESFFEITLILNKTGKGT